MERQWYVSRAGQVFGPIPASHLFQLAVAGQVAPADWVSAVDQPGWWPASAIPGLFPAARPVAPQPAVVNAFAGLDNRAGFEPPVQAEAAAGESTLTNVFGALMEQVGRMDTDQAVEVGRAVRGIVDAVGGWFNGGE